jgi:hypothetical protein
MRRDSSWNTRKSRGALVARVQEERAGGDARARGDRAQRRGVEAVAREDRARGTLDARPLVAFVALAKAAAGSGFGLGEGARHGWGSFYEQVQI